MSRLTAVCTAVLMAAGLLAGPVPAGARPASARSVTPAPPARAAAPSRPPTVAPTYRNPLDLRLPGGQNAASCADPSVLAGHTGKTRTWYLYCTSDALTATEVGAGGSLVQHEVPMFTSTDLTHWRYAGDAFPTKPAWVTGDVWAPDVVVHGGRYLMYFTASNTDLNGGGSAIGVATSASPTGPWSAMDTPVVAPSAFADGTRWNFDPEVIYVGAKTYLYFGSYFGGINVRELDRAGLTSDPATETPIAIDNRYEGTFIVRRGGWFYFMGSATNCCNGPLTGYAVFVARSRNPLGPFRDEDGKSILAGRVGGTPLLTQNGNRWVGTGHNAVLTDYSGQQWIVYHAVDRNDPYYANNVGYTKRPALIDPLDWRNGWPVVRGGRGPSATRQPGPAAQPGERSGYRPAFVRDPRPGRTVTALSDDFRGSTLSSRWTWIRPPAKSTYAVTHGTLSWQTQDADLHPPVTPLASVLTEPAPSGDYVVEAKVSVSVPADGCCQNYVQGGVMIYGGDGHYVKLASVSIEDTRQTEFGLENSTTVTGYPDYGNTVAGPVGQWTYLRIVHTGVDRYTAYTSVDGRHWDHGGTWTASLTSPRVGLISMGGSGFTSRFAYVHVSALR
jgi:arabinan endo-1,5-alpha-L-arabinosidase